VISQIKFDIFKTMASRRSRFAVGDWVTGNEGSSAANMEGKILSTAEKGRFEVEWIRGGQSYCI
jgi:hypothetical protein